LPESAHGIVRLSDEFGLVPSISFDHAIMERTDRAVVVPLDIGWNDVGSYRSLLAAADTDGSGNHVGGDVTLSDVRGSFIRATSRRVVVAGVEKMVVVETPDAVLVVPLDRADEVRDLGSEGRQG
jgi:mannose-1-phosphate guanylyltransferase